MFITTRLQDGYTIAKTYERAASFSPTEEATFAMMRPALQNVRGLSSSTTRQMDTEAQISRSVSYSKATQDAQGDAEAWSDDHTSQGMNLDNLDENSENGRNIFEQVGTQVEKIFDNDCIPCDLRINAMGDLKIQASITGFGEEILALLKQQLLNALAQVKALISMFTNLDRYVDLCAYLKFLSDFVCVPDLTRMLSALMALMSRFSFSLNGMFDLIINLVGPLLQPFLSNVVDVLNRYLLAVLKPLDCIIDSIQDMFRKLDYNVLFQNIEQLDTKIGMDIATGPTETVVPDAIFNGTRVRIPFSSETLTNQDIAVTSNSEHALSSFLPSQYEQPQDSEFRGLEFNMLGWTGIQERKAKEQQAVDDAAKELQLLNQAGRSLDGVDAGRTEAHRAQVDAASERYQAAVREREMSEMQEMSQRLEMFQKRYKGALTELMRFLREAVSVVTSFISQFMDEWKKFMGQFFGGNGNLVLALQEKLNLVNQIAFIRAMIKALSGKVMCDEAQGGKEVDAFINVLPHGNTMTVSLNDDGSISIQEDVESINDAIGEVAASTSGLGDVDDNANKSLYDDSDSSGSGRDAGAKLRSLIDFTGDPVLDGEISETINSLITPVSVTIKCPLQTSAVGTEKVNQWITELNNE